MHQYMDMNEYTKLLGNILVSTKVLEFSHTYIAFCKIVLAKLGGLNKG